ncbi:LPXTG cell wall anchor domain-containing protein [Streptomyces sp. NPDC051561]|uniref:LPXTG cell wall anchor domain-containing protein n=1 Tax=Streptomyces sp. NPDC051561 TaxID=3365658 RepID=UPI0037893EEA
MKLRRSLALAAATAVIAPVSLLSATAVHAETTVTTTPTPSATATPSATPSKPADVPAKDEKPAPGEAQKPEQPKGEEPKKDDGSAPKPVTPPKDKPVTPPKDELGGEDETGGEDGDLEDFCTEETVSVALTGFPNKIVAGSGWKEFTYTVTNHTKKDIAEMEASVFAFSASDEEEKAEDLVTKFAHFEMFDPVKKVWTNDYLLEGMPDGLFVGTFALKAGATENVKLRVSLDKATPAGSSVAVAAGMDLSEADESLCNSGGDFYEFEIVAAGKNPGQIDDSKPTGERPGKPGKPGGNDKPGKPDNGKPGTKPVPDVKPQGGAKEIPVTGDLAQTGASSQLPIFGIAGGTAVVLGAGALVLVRRRKTNA